MTLQLSDCKKQFEMYIMRTRENSKNKNHPLFSMIEKYKQNTKTLDELNTNIFNICNKISNIKTRNCQLEQVIKLINDSLWNHTPQDKLTTFIKMHETLRFSGIVLYSLISCDIDYIEYCKNTNYKFGYIDFFDNTDDQEYAIIYADKKADELYELYKNIKSNKITYQTNNSQFNYRGEHSSMYFKAITILEKEIEQNKIYCDELQLQKLNNQLKSTITFLLSKTTKDWLVVSNILSYL